MSNLPQFFETSGTDPGVNVSSPMPECSENSLSPAKTDLSDSAMPMLSHIAELRTRILVSALVLAVGIAFGFGMALPLIDVLKRMAPQSIVFVQLSPGEVLMASVRVAFYVGFALAAPVILYNLLRFVLPGLVGREKAMVLWSVLGGTVLFAAGVLFAYFFVAPTAIQFLVEYGQSVAATHLSIAGYISFCSSLLFVTGGMFELPMVLFLLSFTGFVTSKKLMAEWRWAMVAIFICAAIVTPTQDPFSMAIVGLAMVLLYAFSIIPIKLCGR